MKQGTHIFAHILAISVIGLFAAAAATKYRRGKNVKSVKNRGNRIGPRLERTDSGRSEKLEIFAHYVARQLGFENGKECPHLCKLAFDYLKKAKGCEESIYEFFSHDSDADSLYVKLIEEFDRCILSYFAYNWNRASLMIAQDSNDDSERKAKLKNFVLSATRNQRFQRVTKDLKVTRVFSTLVEEMKAIGGSISTNGEHCTDIMKPMALNERSPVLLLMGGGMGAGKSTVLKDILKQAFWSQAAPNAVVVEADAFKETDVIYRALSSRGHHHHDMLQTAELVHQSSTDAASSLLVTALNEGRDVIMDGTLSWIPFVEQTIAMARNVHTSRYRMGVGYKTLDDGTTIENYWEQVEENRPVEDHREPYRIELVGVVCDPYLAVVRGMRRAIMIGRAVRVNSQLKSHKRFASAFEGYCKLVDNARLYCTNALGVPPKSVLGRDAQTRELELHKETLQQKVEVFRYITAGMTLERLIGWKDGENNLLVDPEEIKCLAMLGDLNDGADSIEELYNQHNPMAEPNSIWNEMVLSPSRTNTQRELKVSITEIEKAKTTNPFA